jgi:membrane protein required for beta-lactamase induction
VSSGDINEDVDAVIMYLFEANKGDEDKASKIIVACLNAHGPDNVMENLEYRNQTILISDLRYWIVEFKFRTG